MKKQILRAIILVFSGALVANGAQTIRELWDNIPVGPLAGVTNGNTSVGFYPSAAIKWVVNPADPAATNALRISGDNADDWKLARYGDSLPADVGSPRTLALAGTTNGFDSGAWAVRYLDTPARINTGANGVYYFSARLIKRGLWWYDPTGANTNNYGPDDSALGIGFAAGNAAGSAFVGAGFTRTVAFNGGGGYLAQDGVTDIGDTVYITQGTLGQAGYAGHPADSGGPYYVRAYGGLQYVEGYLGGYPDMSWSYVNGGFLVGKLTTSATGSDTLQVYSFVAGETVPVLETDVVWDATYSFNESASLNYLLVWMHGNNNANPCNVDAIRVGTTWADVIGVETVGPTASPTNRVYEGTAITLSVIANLPDATTGTFQWLKAGAPIVGATDTNYIIANPTTADSGSYSVIYQNYYGQAATSQVLTVTVDPYAAPVIVSQPLDGTRLQGATAPISFTVVADGGRPLNYQWKHIVGSVTNVLSGQTNATLVVNGTQAADAGGYLVSVSNLAGSMNSRTATYNVIALTPGSYAAQVVANNPWGYWMLNEPVGTTNLHDYIGGHDGWLDPTNSGVDGTNTFTWGVYQQEPAAQLAGFPANHVGIYVPHNGYQAHAQVPGVSNYAPNMTWMGWICSTNPGANEAGEHGAIIWNRDLDNNGGYGNAFGLTFIQNISGGVTNYNEIAYRWGGYNENPDRAWEGYYHHTGLFMPTSSWCFVAVTWTATNNATIYLGSPTGPLTAATATLPSNFDAGYPGTVYQNRYDILLGRSGYPWAEGLMNANSQTGVSLSDVAVFTNALSSDAIYQIYLAATGELITFTNSAGNLVLSWPYGTLVSSSDVKGPYVPVPGATSPWTVAKTEPKMFYRIQR